jgi:hypothetical protein
MLSLEERRNRQHYWAFLCYETLEDAYLRVKNLLDTGRPIVHIERYLIDGELTVTTGVHIWNEGIRPGIFFRKNEEFAEFSLTLNPVTFGFGWSGYRKEGSESDHAKHYNKVNAVHREPGYVNYRRDVARIDVEGFGDGRNDHTVIRHFNGHGVGKETALYFQYDSHDVRAEREAAFLDVLAERDWTADDIRKLAEKMRKWREPFAENLNFYMKEMNR